MTAARILVVDDDRTVRETLVATLDETGFLARGADGIDSARRILGDQAFDAMLLDIRLRDGDGLALLGELRVAHPKLPIVMATAYGDSGRTIEAMRLGAFEYVTKPFDLPRLLEVIERAVRVRAPARLSSDVQTADLVGSSGTMLEVWKAIGRVAASEVPALITGETGVGKELVARAIHAHSDRRDAPFVAVNIAALPPTLVESELFGHEKGAFTGALARREGRFESAGSGTLLLDEIGDLDPAIQTKLLRVLENGEFQRVGGQETLRSQARILAATSRPVVPGSRGATLREDLYYRLGVVRIEVPPLRDRRSDVPALVDAFLRRARGPRRAVSEAAMDRLVAHDWPGNVRELRHVIENACVMSSSEVLDDRDLRLPEPRGETRVAGAHDLDLKRTLQRVERELIERALARAPGNRAEAARLLGIRRALLYARLREFGMLAPGDADDDARASKPE
jgi:two-component system response regulator AtoC